MKDRFKMVMSVFYEPEASTKKVIEDNKDWILPFHAGSIDKTYDNQWMKDNLLSDAEGDNISNLNSKVNENTILYWIWKHYEEIGDPEYIAFGHYRRLFQKEDIKKVIENNADIVIAPKNTLLQTLRGQYQTYHYKDDLDCCQEVLSEVHPEYSDLFDRYLDQTLMIAPMMLFCMKKDLFFEWQEWIFPVIMRLVDEIDTSGRSNYNKRAICFLVERLFGLWVAKKNNDGFKVCCCRYMFDEEGKTKCIEDKEMSK